MKFPRIPPIPKFVLIGRHKVDPTSIIKMAISSIIGLVVIVVSFVILAMKVGLLSLAEWVVGVVVFCLLAYAFRGYAKHEKVKYFVKKYQTDMTIVGLSIFGIIAINCLVHYLTTAKPEIWQWYWGNQAFFWSWNIGWVIVAFLTSKRDEKGKIVPIASTIRFCVVLTLFVGLGVNLLFRGWPRSPMEETLAKEPVIAVIARCRPAKEFDSVEKVQAASKLYKEKGLLPWQKNMGCWESMISQDMLPVRLAVVEAPTNGWSQVVKSPQINGGAIVDWPGAPECIEVMPNGDESKKLPRNKAIFNFPGYFTQFHSNCSEPEKVEVVVRQ